MTDTTTPEHAKPGFILKDQVYDFLRKLANYVLPALAVLYASLAGFWGFPNVVQVVGTIGAVVIFLNAVLGKSKKNYNNDTAARTDGVLVVSPGNEDGPVIGVGLDQADIHSIVGLTTQKTVTLRVEDAASQ